MNRVRWLNFSTFSLLLLLQRTPALRATMAAAAEYTAPTRIVALLRAAFGTAAALGAVHSLAGATRFVVSSPNVLGTVGTTITPVAFTVTGAAIPAGSFKVSGSLPPGLTVTNANSGGVLNGSTGTITGTPTRSGTYTISILAYEKANATGDAFGPTQIGFIISDTAASGPTLTTQPASQSVVAGANVTLSVVATGSPTPTYQWRKNGTLVAGATNATLTLVNVQPADAGTYTVVVSNSIGVVSSSAATLAVAVTAVTAAITTQPQSQSVALGASTTLAVTATGTGLGYQWKKETTPIPGATNAAFTIANTAAQNMGFYAVTVTGVGSPLTSTVAMLTVQTGGTSRLVNVSTRGYVPAGGALTPGFVLQGNASKALLIRAIGPTLGAFGVGGTLVDPVMDVIPLGETIAIASNDDWGGHSALVSAFGRVGAFPLAGATSRDASAVFKGQLHGIIFGAFNNGFVLTGAYFFGFVYMPFFKVLQTTFQYGFVYILLKLV